MKREKSEKIFAQAKKLLPGGVNSPVRSFGSVGGHPLIAARGEGAYLYDVDHNRFIDLVCSWGPLIHGHSHPKIKEAIESVLSRGASFGVTSKVEVDLCQRIVDCVPS